MLRNMKLKKKKTIPRPTIFKLTKISDAEKNCERPPGACFYAKK